MMLFSIIGKTIMHRMPFVKLASILGKCLSAVHSQCLQCASRCDKTLHAASQTKFMINL